MSNPTVRDLQHQEHDDWTTLCNALRAAKVVTQADLDSLQGSTKTRGQRLLEVIRRWGKSFATLHIAHLQRQTNDIIDDTVERLEEGQL